MTAQRLLRSIPSEAWFIAAGAVLLPVVRVRGSSAAAHAGLLLAISALLAVGAWVRRFLLRLDEETPAPAHAVVIGQASLLLYFYARSALARLGVPGVTGLELALLAAAAAAHLWLRRKPPAAPGGYPAVWLAFWASTLTFLGYRSGRLDTPSSDPDLHAFWARLTAEHGRIIYDLLPQSPARYAYPSGFSALNAIWIDLSRTSAVTVVNCQPALQACLMVALVLELVFALRRSASPGVALPLIALAHGVFSFPVNASLAHLEGTGRLAHSAMLLFPLTFSLRQQRRSAAPVVAAAGFALAWSLVVNPSHLIVELPFAAAAALLGLCSTRREGLWTALAAAAAMAALLWGSDAWLAPLLRAAPAPGAGLTLQWRSAFAAAIAATSGTSLGFACSPGPWCSPAVRGLCFTLGLPLLCTALVTFFLRRRAAAAVVIALAALTGFAVFLGSFAWVLLGDAPSREANLLRGYAHAGLTSAAAILFFTLLAAGLALVAALIEEATSHRSGELCAALAAGLGCGALLLHRPALFTDGREKYSHQVRGAPGSATGALRPDDLRLARASAAVIKPGESVLLPGVIRQMNPWELWYFTLGGARAIPLYTDVPFPFFHTSSPDGPAPFDYRDHVCDRFDLPWLAGRGIVWLFEAAEASGDFCVQGWREARIKYYQRVLQEGGASLWRMRPDRIGQAAGDPELMPPPIRR